jgi:glycosyltransferase involved in cell wall biosynthesis
VDGGAYRPVFQGRRPDTALFVGNFQHPPNREALAFLVQRVWPKLRALRPQAELAVAGAQATPDVEKLSRAPGVRFLGCVADIRACFAEFSVFLCPIFAGSGVRVKILEAWAAGMPVIATPLGAEGLEAAHGRELLLARSAEQFVSATLELFENPELAEQIARRARQVLEERWDWNVVMARLERSYGEALARVRPLVFVTAPPAEELPTPSRV